MVWRRFTSVILKAPEFRKVISIILPEPLVKYINILFGRTNMKKHLFKKILLLTSIAALSLTPLTFSFALTDMGTQTYTVKKDDVLWKIASSYGTSVAELAKINNLKDPDHIEVGQILYFKEEASMKKTDKVIALLKSIETGAQEPVSYINPNNYTQHNLAVKDGLSGFGELLGQLPENSAKVEVIRAFEDGNYVFTHTDYNFFGPKVGFDIFRFEDGLIVEHWDNLAVKNDGTNPSGHSQLDGETAIKDLDKTQENKDLVKNFVNDILVNGKMEKLQNYFDGDNYIQHNTNIADGLSGLGTALQKMAEQGITMEYTDIHMVLGQGNFVLVVSEGSFGGEHVSFYDLFRVENNKITEHWDVIETIPGEDQWMNDNGKF